ncbi:MAG: antibiotic biosynthesis monooxygenase [Rhodospirillales bacterium]|nr:antibiotic biosynthesis monooxygenase [Rhodospirillales bacterium]
MANLVNLVHVSCDPSVREELLDKLWVNVLQARQEEGCFQFDVSVKSDDPNAFIFYEVYKDEAALAVHKEQQYFLDYFQFVTDMGEKVNRTFTIYWVEDR